MSRNGNGVYTLPAGNPVVPSTVIATTWANNTMNDLASAMTDSVAADGQTPMTGPLNMNSNKVTNLATGTISGDGVNYAQFNTPTFGGAVVCSSTLAVTGATTLSGAAVANTFSSSGATITGGAIDGTTIGTTTRSTVKATTLDLGLSTQSAAIGQGDSSAIKNRIINGAMLVNQRGGTVTGNDSAYSLDRWKASCVPDGKFTMEQSSTAPTGFINSLLVTSTSAYSVVSTDFIGLRQDIEGLNCTDLGWGTAQAKTVTLSFQVYSSLTGNFGGSLFNNAANRSYPFSYTISSANTWTTVSVTIAGDTSGTWLTTNGRGICVFFSLGSGSSNSGTAGAWAGSFLAQPTGSTSVVGTNGATWYVTGVQLEVGSQATGFEYRQVTTETQLCQRYYYKIGASVVNSMFGVGWNISTTQAVALTTFPTTMRTSPSALEQTGTAADYAVFSGAGSGVTCSAVPSFGIANQTNARILLTVASGLTANGGSMARAETANGYLAWSAEL